MSGVQSAIALEALVSAAFILIGSKVGDLIGRQRAAQRRAYALVGAAAAVGPLIGGFITTYLSWRLAFLLEDVIIIVVLAGIKLVHDVPYTRSRQVDVVGAILSVLGMGGVVLSILVWQEGGEAVGGLLALGAVSLAALAWWLVRRKRAGEATLLDPDLPSGGSDPAVVPRRITAAPPRPSRPYRRHRRPAGQAGQRGRSGLRGGNGQPRGTGSSA